MSRRTGGRTACAAAFSCLRTLKPGAIECDGVLLRWIVVAVVFVALLFLSLQNAQKVTLRVFNLDSWEAPLGVRRAIAFACGVAAGLLAGAFRSRA